MYLFERRIYIPDNRHKAVTGYIQSTDNGCQWNLKLYKY